jgi:hypothetical protein
MTPMSLILLGCIAWPIRLIWLSKHCWNSLWWCGLKVCYNVYSLILPTHLKGIWSSLRLWNSWQQNSPKCEDKMDFDVEPYQESYGKIQNSTCENGL